MCIALYLRAWRHCMAAIIGGCANRVAQHILPIQPDVRFGIKLLLGNVGVKGGSGFDSRGD